MKQTVLLFLALIALNLHAVDAGALTPVKTIPLPGVSGRIDHFALDTQGKRLFMAALGNDTVEVIDLAAGKRSHTIGDCSTPQGLAFAPAENRLIIANGGSGVVKTLDATTFKTIASVGDMPDADNVRYDAKTGLIYVGYGDGALGIIRATNGELIASIKLAGHPESFQLEPDGSSIFVNVPDAQQVAVIDRDKRIVVATWSLARFHSNFPIALDAANHRLFIGCRHPSRLVVLDTKTGKRVDDVEISGDTDDLFYDASRKQIYVSCGAGFIDVIAQHSADTYQSREHIPTVGGARTSFLDEKSGELYLAVRAGMISGGAELRVFKCSP